MPSLVEIGLVVLGEKMHENVKSLQMDKQMDNRLSENFT